MTYSRDQSMAVRRSFHLIQALLSGYTTRREIEAFIRAALPGEEPYEKARDDKWQSDRERVASHFGVEVAYNQTTKTNHIVNLPPHGWLALPPTALRTLVLLRETFREDAPFHDEVTAFIETLLAVLPTHQYDAVQSGRYAPSLNLHSLDHEILNTAVLEQIQTAVYQHHVLDFDYCSPRQPDKVPRRHTVEPIELQFTDGHWYLYGYWRQSKRQQEDPTPQGRHMHFRLTAIVPGSITLSSEIIARRDEPRRTLHYLLHPALTQDGMVSARFPNTQQVGTRVIQGELWLEMTATILPSQEFRAAQLFLRYGNKCRVLGPTTLRQRIITLVQELAGVYLEEADQF